MTKLLPLAVAVVSTFALGSAQAVALLVDNFNTPLSGGQTASDNVAGGPGTGVSSGVYNIPSGNGIALTRELIAECSSGLGTPATPCMQVVAGADGLGGLQFLNRTNTTGNGSVIWSIASFTVTNPASLLFVVVASNPQGSSVVDFRFDGNGDGLYNNVSTDFTLSSQSFGNVPTSLPFMLTATQAGLLSAGGALRMDVSGGQGWNATIDAFSIEMPEPGSVALVGLALVGAGVASRRRKA